MPEQLQLPIHLGDEMEGSVREMVDWLVRFNGCSPEQVESIVRDLYQRFSWTEAFNRVKAVNNLFGTHAIPGLAQRIDDLGLFDPDTDYHTIWDRCWATHYLPLDEALQVMSWDYRLANHYKGKPADCRYTTKDGRKVVRLYKEG